MQRGRVRGCGPGTGPGGRGGGGSAPTSGPGAPRRGGWGGARLVPAPLTAASLQVRAALAALLCAALLPLRSEAVKAPKRPARTRTCGERPEELLEQLYGRLAAGMLSAFHHTLQPEPAGQRQHNASCPAGGRPAADKRFRLPVNLRSASPWAYR